MASNNSLRFGRIFTDKWCCNTLMRKILLKRKNFIGNRFNCSAMNATNLAKRDSVILEQCKTSFKVKYTAVDVESRGVFANNELNLSEIEIFGFDYDYTLAVYKDSLHYLIYDLGKDVLINKYKYPKDIISLDYIPDFAIRGLHYDVENGLLMKIDSFHQIQLGSVYRGLTPVSDEEVLKIYNGSYIPQKLIRATEGEVHELRMKQLNDLFSVPEICLLSNVTEYFNKHNIAYHPEILYYDIQNAVQSIHPKLHKMLDENLIDRYLEKQSDLKAFLDCLVQNNKKIFLITNSPFKFVDNGMKYMIGPNWNELFDVIVVHARKPKFFTQQRRPFRHYNKESDCQMWEKVLALEKGKVYMEGTVSQLLEMTGWQGNRILYFGDQIYTDLADIQLNFGWRTGAVIFELEKEIETHNSKEFREALSALSSIQELIDDGQQQAETDQNHEVLQKLMEQRDILRSKTKTLFNPQFGSIFRTHSNPTYFSRRLFRYSDIYMSQVTNLLNYSMKHIFCPRRGLLPHESKISHVELITE